VPASTGNQWCAYPDGACGGGLRFSDYDVGDGLAGQCVGGGSDVDASPDDVDAHNPIGWGLAVTGGSSEYVTHIASDPSGNVYVTGVFWESVSFGGRTASGSGDTDVFVAKVSSQGSVLWLKTYGSAGTEETSKLVADADGVTVGGIFQQSVNFGDGARTAVGFADVFVLRLDAQGDFRWAKTAGGTIGDSLDGLAADSTGNVYAAGTFTGQVSFGGTPLVSQNGPDLFVVKYSAAGAHLWSVRVSGQAESVADLAVVGDEPVIAGSFQGQINFGGEALTATGAGADLFAVRLRANDGAHVWSLRAGGSGAESISDVIPSRDGVLLAGYFRDVAGFGTDVLSATGDYDAFLWKLTSNGTHAWARRFGGAGLDRATAVIEAPNGDAAIFGGYAQPFEVSGTALPADKRVFLVRVHADGASFEGKGLGGTVAGVTPGVTAVDGDLVIAGSFEGAIDFFGHMLNNASTMRETDGFLIRE
jgi:hypothetical protein